MKNVAKTQEQAIEIAKERIKQDYFRDVTDLQIDIENGQIVLCGCGETKSIKASVMYNRIFVECTVGYCEVCGEEFNSDVDAEISDFKF